MSTGFLRIVVLCVLEQSSALEQIICFVEPGEGGRHACKLAQEDGADLMHEGPDRYK